MHVIVDDLLVSYESLGTGKRNILFLHGWADPSDTFNPLIKQIDSQKYTIVVLDLAGFGGSQHPPEAWDIIDYSKHVSHFIEKLSIEPYAILGHSNGGAIAINAVANDLVKPKNLILVASSGIRSIHSVKKIIYMMLAKPAKLILLPLPLSAQKKLKRTIYQKIGSDLYAAEHMAETFRKVVSYDIQKDAKKVSIPTLLIYGEQDRITPPSHGKILSSLIRNSKLEIINDAGHFVHQSKANVVAESIKTFLK
jgi:pimeloyl-ACP methyl ester carboxylesterase